MEEEIWKPVPGYEGIYEVSSHGRVKTFSKHSKAGYGGIRKLTPPKFNQCRYLRVLLTKDSKPIMFYVHQLVAMAFLGHKRSGYKSIVDHIDNNCLNNYVENLQIISQRENSCKDMRNKTGYKCVTKVPGGYRAVTKIDGKMVYCGYAKTAKAAHRKYLNVMREHLKTQEKQK